MVKRTITRKVKKPKPSRLETKLRRNGLLAIKELSKYFDVSETTVYKLAKQGKLQGQR